MNEDVIGRLQCRVLAARYEASDCARDSEDTKSHVEERQIPMQTEGEAKDRTLQSPERKIVAASIREPIEHYESQAAMLETGTRAEAAAGCERTGNPR